MSVLPTLPTSISTSHVAAVISKWCVDEENDTALHGRALDETKSTFAVCG